MNLPRLILALVFAVGVGRAAEEAPAAPPLPEGLYAELGTPRGTITCELCFRQAPLTVASFVGLAEGTLGPAPRRPFFNGLTFHRVVPDFVIQGGDPTATGDGGPGYQFPDEFVPGLRHDAVGILAMANDGPDTNGSQFFLTLRPVHRLNYLHSVFGRTVRGFDVLEEIKAGDAMTVKIVRRGAAAEAFRADDAAWAGLVQRAKRYAGAAEPGPTAHCDDPDKVLPAEPPRARAFNFKLANLERSTGLKIVARFFAKSPAAADDAVPGEVMRKLATQLGVAERGVAVAYFADEDDWRVWIGDALAARFVGRPGTAEEFTANGAIHDTKEALLQAAHAAAEAAFAAQKKAAKPGQEPPPAQRIKLEADAILDALILKLEPAADPTAEITGLLTAQAAAWNRGDIDGFMQAYAPLETLRFASGGKVTRGWQSTLAGYRKSYPDQAAMGRLEFTGLEVTVLAPDAALVFGRWKLSREKDAPEGLFTLTWKRTAAGWRIIQDHTSSAR